MYNLKNVFNVIVVATIITTIQADVYDHLMPAWKINSATCTDTCLPWNAMPNATEQKRINKVWRYNVPPASAGSSCAMPGASAGNLDCDGCTADTVTNSYAGPWCYCKTPVGGHNHTQYCVAPKNTPEQINLQIADATSVVASFVTREEKVPKGADLPIAYWGESKHDLTKVTGITHHYKHLSEAEGISYSLHFIKLAGLEPDKVYYYKVQSANSIVSELFTFRWINQKEPKFAIYGDMGHTHHNNMENMKNACENGEIDFIVHMGDHAYDLAGAGDRRGDAYMNVFMPVLSSCPWIPIIGNHEVNDGDHYERYINMTFGQTLGGDDSIKSTATTALGELLTKSTLFGLGFHSKIPSNTSRYFSLTIGTIHIVGLDLNNLDDGQLKWLDEDLASVDRKETPWILVSSHFPMYHPTYATHLNASRNFFLGEGHEQYSNSDHDYVPLQCHDGSGDKVCHDKPLGEWLNGQQSKLLPLLRKHGVDLYDAGHKHDYASTWPICHGEICRDSTGKPIQSYLNPIGTVHITEGNGGVPGVVGTNTLKPMKITSWSRNFGTGGAYGRIVVFNETHLQYSHHENPTDKVTDQFFIEQHNGHHGPF